MKTVEVPNELMERIIRVLTDGRYTILSEIKEQFPELFEPKFKVGDWVKNEFVGIGRLLGFDDDGDLKLGNLLHNDGWRAFQSSCAIATDEELKAHLIKIWESKGGKEGVRFKSAWNDKEFTCSGKYGYFLEGDLVDKARGCIYDAEANVWATIIEESKVIELTLEDIAKLKGVDVKLIKIVK